MREIHNKEIGGTAFVCQQLPAMEAVILLNRLATSLGSEAVPLLSKIAATELGKNNGKKDDEALDVLGLIDISGILDQLRGQGDRYVLDVMLQLFGHCWTVDTSKSPPSRSSKSVRDSFDETFSRRGGVKTAFFLFAWVLEVNFREYFSDGPSSDGAI